MPTSSQTPAEAMPQAVPSLAAGFEPISLEDLDVEGDRPRHKIRSRLDGQSGICSLEVRVKEEDGETVEHALPYAAEGHGRLTARPGSPTTGPPPS